MIPVHKIADLPYVTSVCASLSVQNGHVQLRDWTNYKEFDEFQRLKKKRKGQTEQQIASNFSRLWKTQLCYNFVHHPDSCPLPKHVCRFAHGADELRSVAAKV